MVKHEPIVAEGAPPVWHAMTYFSLVVLAVACFWAELQAPLNHDVAWLLDAGSRWWGGERLYIDVMENNPPLILYVYAALTLGTFSKAAVIAGVTSVILVSSIWVARLRGPRWGIATFIICVGSGLLDFGQRDHLAAIVMFPYLWANNASTRERALIGAWSFLGFGLKPYLMLVPAAVTLVKMLRDRSIRPLLVPENCVLGILSMAYVIAVAVWYPQFFTSMVPLTLSIYFAYGAGLAHEPLSLALVGLATITGITAARDPQLAPETGALIGALASYFIQGRFWSYQLVPAVAATFLLLLLLSRREKHRARFTVTLILIAALSIAMFVGFRRKYQDPIPAGAKSVLFLSPHPSSTYPAVLERGVRNASRYPALWPLPGAWRILQSAGSSAAERDQARQIIEETRRNTVDDIIRYCPNPIFVDVRERKPYFNGPFDFIAFLEADPRFTGYRPAETVGIYRLYRRITPCTAWGGRDAHR